MKNIKIGLIVAILTFITVAFTTKTDGYKVGDKI